MSDFDKVTGRQIAAARALVGLTQGELAARARISAPTLRRMEASDGPASGYANNVAAVCGVLGAAGVEFIPENSGGPGVAAPEMKSAQGLAIANNTDRAMTVARGLTPDRRRSTRLPQSGVVG